MGNSLLVGIVCIHFLFFMGCSFKGQNKEGKYDNSNTYEEEDSKERLDSDGDGWADENDYEPTVPNLPQVNILEFQKLKIELLMNRGGEGEKLNLIINRRRRTKINAIAKIRANKVKKLLLRNHFRFGDLDHKIEWRDVFTYPLFKWRDQEYYPLVSRLIDKEANNLNEPATIELSFKIGLVNLKGVNEVKNIKFSLGFLGESGEFEEIKEFYLLSDISNRSIFKFSEREKYFPGTTFKVLFSDINSTELIEHILKRRLLAIMIQDFQFKRGKREFSFAQVLEDVRSKNHLAIYSEGNSFKTKFLMGGKTIESALSTLQIKNVFFDENGTVVGIGKLGNSLFDLEKITYEDLEKGFWISNNDGDGSVGGKVESGSILYLIYLRGKDYLQLKRISSSEKKMITVNDRELIKGIKGEDILELEISGSKITPIISKPINKQVEVGAYDRVCIPDDYRPWLDKRMDCEEIWNWGKWCEIRETIPTSPNKKELTFVQQLPISLEIGGEMFPFYEFLLPENEIVFLEDGKKIMLRAYFPLEKIRNGKIFIVNKKKYPNKTLPYGLVGYSNCDVRFKKGFDFKSYDPGPHNLDGMAKNIYQFSFSIIKED